LPEHALGLPDFVSIVAFDDHFVLAGTDLHAELGFEQLEVLVERTEEAFGALFGQGDLARRRCGRNSSAPVLTF
jgi:hypothetical protein